MSFVDQFENGIRRTLDAYDEEIYGTGTRSVDRALQGVTGLGIVGRDVILRLLMLTDRESTGTQTSSGQAQQDQESVLPPNPITYLREIEHRQEKGKYPNFDALKYA